MTNSQHPDRSLREIAIAEFIETLAHVLVRLDRTVPQSRPSDWILLRLSEEFRLAGGDSSLLSGGAATRRLLLMLERNLTVWEMFPDP